MSLWAFLLPVFAAMAYVGAALFLKRSAELGAGVWHSTFVSNVFSALVFQGLLVFGGSIPSAEHWWQPAAAAVLFLSGQIWTLVSLQRGDVSIATPVLGLKILLVALFTTLLLSQGLSWRLWLAAALSTCGVATLNYSGARRTGGAAAMTIATAGIAAASFALFDVVVQKWSPAWGMGRFLPLTVGLVGLMSLATVPLFRTPLRALPRGTKWWLGMAGGLFALQSILFVSSIAAFGQATAANIIYSLRGVGSVVAVALFGHWLRLPERQIGGAALRWRLFGAALMFAAVALLFV